MSYSAKEEFYVFADRIGASLYDTGSVFADRDMCIEIWAINDDEQKLSQMYVHKDDVKKLIDDITKCYNEQKIIPIPNNATNGEIIKALFPSAEVFETDGFGYEYVYVTADKSSPSWKIQREWWDSPYKEHDNGTNEK